MMYQHCKVNTVVAAVDRLFVDFVSRRSDSSGPQRHWSTSLAQHIS